MARGLDCYIHQMEDYEGKDVAGSLDTGLNGTHVVGHSEKAERPCVKRIKHGEKDNDDAG